MTNKLLIIYILGQHFEEECLNIEGLSTTIYPFLWNKIRGRYEYAPNSKEETEDLFQSQSINSLFYFAAELADGQGAASGAPARAIPPPALERKYYGDFDREELLASLADAGVKVPDGESADRNALLGLLDAYWLGRGYKLVHGRETGPFLSAPAPATTETGVEGTTVTAPDGDMPEMDAPPVSAENFEQLRSAALEKKPKGAGKPRGMARAAQLAPA